MLDHVIVLPIPVRLYYIKEVTVSLKGREDYSYDSHCHFNLLIICIFLSFDPLN